MYLASVSLRYCLSHVVHLIMVSQYAKENRGVLWFVQANISPCVSWIMMCVIGTLNLNLNILRFQMIKLGPLILQIKHNLISQSQDVVLWIHHITNSRCTFLCSVILSNYESYVRKLRDVVNKPLPTSVSAVGITGIELLISWHSTWEKCHICWDETNFNIHLKIWNENKMQANQFRYTIWTIWILNCIFCLKLIWMNRIMPLCN